jgi:DNA-binding NtrC family response regulator
MARIMIADDEVPILRIMASLLISKGHTVKTALDGEEAINILQNEPFDLLISDIRMSPMDGIALLRFVKEHCPSTQTLMLTAYASVDTAIESLKLGAFDYITKPFDVSELLATVGRAIEYSRILAGNTAGSQPVQSLECDTHYYYDNIIAESAAMIEVCESIKHVASTETLVSIVGETGTGKGLIAEALHRNSKRKDRALVRVNCAMIPGPLLGSELFGHIKGAFPGANALKRGYFEQLHGGTVYLEEVSLLPADIQERLFRAIQDKTIFRIGGTEPIPVSVRLIVSSNSDIETMVKSGSFREDLYFRLNVVTIRVKPLRERKEDILPLFCFMLKRNSQPNGGLPSLDERAAGMIEHYTWPGNVEELENTVKQLLQKNLNVITPESLPGRISSVIVPESSASSTSKSNRAKALMAYLQSKGAAPEPNTGIPNEKAGK